MIPPGYVREDVHTVQSVGPSQNFCTSMFLHPHNLNHTVSPDSSSVYQVGYELLLHICLNKDIIGTIVLTRSILTNSSRWRRGVKK